MISTSIGIVVVVAVMYALYKAGLSWYKNHKKSKNACRICGNDEEIPCGH